MTTGTSWQEDNQTCYKLTSHRLLNMSKASFPKQASKSDCPLVTMCQLSFQWYVKSKWSWPQWGRALCSNQAGAKVARSTSFAWMDLNHIRCIKSCRENDWNMLHQARCQISADYITLIPSLSYWSIVVICHWWNFQPLNFVQTDKKSPSRWSFSITNQDINKGLLESLQDNERAFKVYVT